MFICDGCCLKFISSWENHQIVLLHLQIVGEKKTVTMCYSLCHSIIPNTNNTLKSLLMIKQKIYPEISSMLCTRFGFYLQLAFA